MARVAQSEEREISCAQSLVENPRVSVLMITYNHAKYLAEAIEGVVQQVCAFPLELIIGEDASRDETLRIALEYQRRYPQIIRVVHSATNVGMNANSLRIFERARGEFVAYCEGDDYWSARDKLARQVDLMERDDGIGIVHTDWARARFHNGHWIVDSRRSAHSRIPSKYLVGDLFQTWYLPKLLRTCTILLRRSTMRAWYDSGLMDPGYPFGDSVLSAWITSQSRVGYVPAVTAIYRVSPGSALRSGAEARVRFYRASLRFDDVARSFFAGLERYPSGYRWESLSALLVWGLRAGDVSAATFALREFTRYFTIGQFLAVGWKSVCMRLPSISQRPPEAADESPREVTKE